MIHSIKFLLAAGLALAVGVAYASSVDPERSNRQQMDRDAKSQFSALQFFRDGHGMHLSPGLISMFNMLTDENGRVMSSVVRKYLERHWGLVMHDDRVSGLFEVEYEKLRVGVVGCVVCHSGKAAGQFVVGLGNKNIDIVTLANDVHRLEENWKNAVPSFLKTKPYKSVEKSALAFSKYLGDDRIGNLSQGLVPVSFIRGWFYRVLNEPIPHSMTRGQVKVPSLWGYGVKRKVGQFCDGYGNGVKPGWAVAVELAAGQKSSVVRGYMSEVEHAEELFEHFLPPDYPFAVDQTRARRGQAVFAQSCSGCHGQYHRDESGDPVFEVPKFVNWNIVRTDRDRLEGNTSEFNAQVQRSPLRDLIQFNSYEPGYFAPRLVGIWARFPYLHNGSVPNLRALLTRASERPKRFSLRAAGERERFSQRDLGLTLTANLNGLSEREIYDVSRIGHSNQGHEFFTDLSASDKTDLIEYLKTL